MTTTLLLRPGLCAFCHPTITADRHRHAALQIVWPNSGGCWQVNTQSGNQCLLIGSNVEHDLSARDAWIVLLERQSTAGQCVEQILKDQPMTALGDLPAPATTDAELQWLRPLWQALGIERDALSPVVHDQRLQGLLDRLNQCFSSSCLKPTQWRAKHIALDMAMSESRFLHLFSEHMHIAWRPYLLWRRLLCAVQAISSGKNATEAAYIAGFSDSAHLSRTFRATFGVSIRDAVTLARQRDRLD